MVWQYIRYLHGTQNNVLELWSLFDFLMPGLLGTERQFTARYSRPILAARDPRASPHHLQAGALACEALHRQVPLPSLTILLCKKRRKWCFILKLIFYLL